LYFAVPFPLFSGKSFPIFTKPTLDVHFLLPCFQKFDCWVFAVLGRFLKAAVSDDADPRPRKSELKCCWRKDVLKKRPDFVVHFLPKTMSSSRRRNNGGARVYIGGISRQTRIKDVEEFFRRYARRFDVLLKDGFGFIVSILNPTGWKSWRVRCFVRFGSGESSGLVLSSS